MSLFPESTDLYVGPGFKEAFMPGYPTKKDSPMLESDFKCVAAHPLNPLSSLTSVEEAAMSTKSNSIPKPQ